MIIFEDNESINLYDFMKKNKIEKIEIELFLKISIQLSKILFQLQKHKIVHCDINPSNIIIGDNYNLTLIDFGKFFFHFFIIYFIIFKNFIIF